MRYLRFAGSGHRKRRCVHGKAPLMIVERADPESSRGPLWGARGRTATPYPSTRVTTIRKCAKGPLHYLHLRPPGVNHGTVGDGAGLLCMPMSGRPRRSVRKNPPRHELLHI